MGKCVYCGKPLPERPLRAKVHTRAFEVCCEACREQTERYVKQDKKWKLLMYLMIFVGGTGFLLSAFLGSGRYGMTGAYAGQILAGLAFLFFPYPIASFETFHAMSIKAVTLLCRVIGLVFVIWGVVLLIFI
ncbi:MAG: TRASH domain-containing protein [Intestinibacillus sp.]